MASRSNNARHVAAVLERAGAILALGVVVALIPATSGCTVIGYAVGKTAPSYQMMPAASADGSPDLTLIPPRARVEVRTSLPRQSGFHRVEGTYLGLRDGESEVAFGEVGRVIVVATDEGEQSLPMDRVRVIRVQRRDGSHAALGLLMGAMVDVIIIAVVVDRGGSLSLGAQ